MAHNVTTILKLNKTHFFHMVNDKSRYKFFYLRFKLYFQLAKIVYFSGRAFFDQSMQKLLLGSFSEKQWDPVCGTTS